MLNTPPITTTAAAMPMNKPLPARATEQLRTDVLEICKRIPPLWDLTNYVAVNPFLGFSDLPLPEAARTIYDGISAQVLPGIGFYRERWQAKAFDRRDLEQAAARHSYEPDELEAILKGAKPIPTRAISSVMTCAEQHDLVYGTRLHEAVVQHTTLWCSIYIPTDGATPWGGTASGSLFTMWREVAAADRSLVIAGLRGWKNWVQQLPREPYAALAHALNVAGIAPAQQRAYLYRLMGGVFGWASYLRRSTWQQEGEAGAVLDLLAIRACTDVAVSKLAARPAHAPPRITAPITVEDEQVRMVLQEALEDGFVRRVVRPLPPPTATEERPAVQAFFCIDVRSEVFRRHLEALSPTITTMGFAGFFGVSLNWHADGHATARCPVLLQPAVEFSSKAAPRHPRNKLLADVQKAPGSAFTFVETLGLAYGVGLLGDALRWFQGERADEGTAPFSLEPDGKGGGIPLEGRIAAGAAILKNMGLREMFGRIVLLAGHGSTSENNPHAAGLDCGACGGHGGAINARIAAAILNDPAVREGLVAHGWQIPQDTWFVPALHDTTRDVVTFYDTAHLPASHRSDLTQLQQWLDQAGSATRAERAATLGIDTMDRRAITARIEQRARDWSEVRPEWALARNAAFIAARRARTRGVDLGGRSFLHEYDWRTDPDDSILSLILNAPMVVASWINLQYFGSTVDNQMFGCGTKALHNRIGALGVVLGNGGDLRTGLALQSVQAADGSWYHEPLRLQVVVEAPCEKIDAVLAASPSVVDLIENGWVRLFALDPHSNKMVQRVPGRGWATA